MNDNISLKGHIQIWRDGVCVVDKDNVGLNVGKARIAAILSGPAVQSWFMAIGKDNTPADPSDVGCVDELQRLAVSDRTLVTTAQTNDTIRFSVTFSFPAAQTVAEAAIVGAPFGPAYAFFRQVFTDQVMPTGSALTVVWTVQVL